MSDAEVRAAFVVPAHGEEPSRVANARFVKARLESFELGPVHVVTHDDRGCTRSSLRNTGAHRAIEQGATVVVFVDADAVVSRPAYQEAIAAASSDRWAWALAYDSVAFLEDHHTSWVRQHDPWEDPTLVIDPKTIQGLPGPYPVGFSTAVLAEAFLDTAGFDEGFVEHGGEDTAYGWVLQCLWSVAYKVRHRALHLWHPRDVERQAAFTETAEWRRLVKYQQAALAEDRMRELIRTRDELEV